MHRSQALLGLLLLCGTEAFAQADPGPQTNAGPAPVLVVTREQFKPGNMANHNKQVPAFLAFFEKAKVGTYRLGLLPIAGDQDHLLYFEGYSSWAEREAVAKKMDDVLGASPALQAELDALTSKNDPLHESRTVWLARLRTDLSYRPNTWEQTGRARYFNVTVTRVNTGRGPDYVAYLKQTNAAREKANFDEHTAIYQVVSGAPAGTFLVLSTTRAMSEYDDNVRDADARGKKFTEAVGGDAVVKERQKMWSEIVAETTWATYRVDRALSRPRPEYVAADPEFWKAKVAAKQEVGKKLAIKK